MSKHFSIISFWFLENLWFFLFGLALTFLALPLTSSSQRFGVSSALVTFVIFSSFSKLDVPAAIVVVCALSVASISSCFVLTSCALLQILQPICRVSDPLRRRNFKHDGHFLSLSDSKLLFTQLFAGSFFSFFFFL